MTKGKNSEPRLTVKRTVTGLGLCSVRSIARGQRIIEYTGAIITNEQVAKSRSKYLMELDAQRTIDGSRARSTPFIRFSIWMRFR